MSGLKELNRGALSAKPGVIINFLEDMLSNNPELLRAFDNVNNRQIIQEDNSDYAVVRIQKGISFSPQKELKGFGGFLLAYRDGNQKERLYNFYAAQHQELVERGYVIPFYTMIERISRGVAPEMVLSPVQDTLGLKRIQYMKADDAAVDARMRIDHAINIDSAISAPKEWRGYVIEGESDSFFGRLEQYLVSLE